MADVPMPDCIKLEIEQRAKNWGAPTVAHRHMEEVASMVWDEALEAAAVACEIRAGRCGKRALPVSVGEACATSIRFLKRQPQGGVDK